MVWSFRARCTRPAVILVLLCPLILQVGPGPLKSPKTRKGDKNCFRPIIDDDHLFPQPPLARRKSDGAISSVKLWLKPDRCPSLSRFRRKNLLPTLRKIAAEVYSNARLQDRHLCSQNPLLPSFSFSFLREKNVAPYLQYLYLSTVYLARGRWGSFVCGKNRTWQANRVLPLVLLMSHVLWTSFSRAFRLISFILLVSSKALGLCCADFFAE